MCKQCLIESGTQIVKNEKVYKCVHLVIDLYKVKSSGGAAHVVTDDYNMEDENIEFCLNLAKENGSHLEIAVLELMQTMTLDERFTTMGIVDGYIE